MAEKWWQTRAVAFDVETGGVNVFEDRIVTAAVVHLTPGERPRTLAWVIDSGVPIPAEAAAIHGWTDEKVRAHPDVRTPEAALFEIAGQVALAMSVGAPLIGFNLAFDLSMLEAECRRHKVPTLAERLAPKGIRGVVDGFVIDRALDPYRKGKRTLPVTCEHYKVLHGGAHTADADALAAARLVPRLVERFPELAKMSLPQLFDAQIGWHRERQESFAAYLRKQGKDASDVNGEWPVRVASTTAEVA